MLSKLRLSFFSILFSLFWNGAALSEIYACAHEMSRFGKPGEIETKTYTREGNLFYSSSLGKLEIEKETKDFLLLKKIIVDSFFIVIIDKNTKEFTESFLGIADSRERDVHIHSYGECVLG